MVTTRTPSICVLGLLLAAATLTGCASLSAGGGPLQAVETTGTGVIVQNVQRDPTWSLSGFTACVLRVPGTFQVTEFGLLEPSDDVTESGGLYFGDEPGADVKPGLLPDSYVPAAGFDTVQLQITPCPPEARAFAVGVEVTSSQHWEAKGVSMTYIADGSTHVLQWDFDIQVCAIGPDAAEGCQGPPQV